jgi:hypothetical protein
VKAGAELVVVVGGAEGLDLGADIEGVERAQARRGRHVIAWPTVDRDASAAIIVVALG